MVIGLLIGLLLGAGGAWLVLRALHKGERRDARVHDEGACRRRAREQQRVVPRRSPSRSSSSSSRRRNRISSSAGRRSSTSSRPSRSRSRRSTGSSSELEVVRAGAYSELRTQVGQLVEAQKELRSETGNLVSALRDRPNVRGRWGEIQLRRVVEMAGMVEHCDFETQKHVATEDGRLRPDLVVSLPGGEERRRRLEVRRAGVPRVARCEDRRRAAREAPRPRPPGTRPRDEAVGEELLVAVREHARVRRALHPRRDVPQRGARAGSGAHRGRREPAGDHRDADDAHRAPPRRRLRLAAGDDRRVGARRSATSAASCTRGSRPSPSTSPRSAAGSRRRSSRTTRRSARSRPGCSRAPGSSRSTASPRPASSPSSTSSTGASGRSARPSYRRRTATPPSSPAPVLARGPLGNVLPPEFV